jgi:DNA-directed RNA polymerase subunit RPC12/RpoP
MVFVYIGIIIWLISMILFKFERWILGIVGGGLGFVMLIISFIVLPGMKKCPDALRKEQAGHAHYNCEFCGLTLKYEPITQTYRPCPECSRPRCRICKTVLIHNEVTQVYDCPYCHVGFGVGDL